MAVLSNWLVVLYGSYCPFAAAARVRVSIAATCARSIGLNVRAAFKRLIEDLHAINASNHN